MPGHRGFRMGRLDRNIKSKSEIRYTSLGLFQRDMFIDNLDIMWTVAFHKFHSLHLFGQAWCRCCITIFHIQESLQTFFQWWTWHRQIPHVYAPLWSSLHCWSCRSLQHYSSDYLWPTIVVDFLHGPAKRMSPAPNHSDFGCISHRDELSGIHWQFDG